MTNNGSSYIEERRNINKNNIKRWQGWSQSINYVVEQFNDVITNLTDRLNIAETTIQALNTKIDMICDHVDARYVKLQYDTIQIASSDRHYYTKTCGVFSCSSINKEVPNIVYVYSKQTNKGVYINNQPVYEKHIGDFSLSDTTYYMPFMQFTGSDAGTIITIKTDNAEKLGNNLNLYFSVDSSIKSTSIDEPNNNDIAKLTVNINYSQVVVKDLVTLDKSKLTQAIINKTAIPAEMMAIDKLGTTIGQYTTINTPANVANKTKNLLDTTFRRS